MNPKTPHSLLTAKQAGEYLGLTESRIRYETHLKRIPFIKIGRTVRYTTDELDKWIESRKSQGGEK
jgi:excisionase family DNA binding protein